MPIEQLNEEELAAALEHTYGITAGHAAELAAAHRGRLPADVDRIPLELPDPSIVWDRERG